MINQIRDFIYPHKQISSAPLIVFRIIFGALMLFGTCRFISYGWVNDLYIAPKFYFTYYGFDWVHPLPGNWMYVPFILMIIGSIGIILGAFYRFSNIVFFLSFTYIELLDKTNYLNHYYFVSLVAFLLILVPAHCDFSIDAKRNPSIRSATVSQWTIRILQFQLGCVYIFAGIAKLEGDWLLHAQPLKTWLQAHRDMPIFGNLLAKEATAYIFSWFGCFYDLFIVFFLLIQRTRPWAYLAVIVFHLLTWYLFPIGVFPWVMIFCTLIFFSSNFHAKIIDRLKVIFAWKLVAETHLKTTFKKVTSFGLILFISLQLLLPFRYLAYPGELFWNEEGFRFSWRVMLIQKQANATFYVKDRTTQREIEIINTDYLTERQVDQMSTQPDMILQFAHHLASIYKDTTLHFGSSSISLNHPSVHASVYATLNGRPNQLMIDKKHDLTQFKYNLCHREWLEDFIQ